MKKHIIWKVVLLATTVIVSFVFFLPNTPLFQGMPDWWKKNMPSKGISAPSSMRSGPSGSSS